MGWDTHPAGSLYDPSGPVPEDLSTTVRAEFFCMAGLPTAPRAAAPSTDRRNPRLGERRTNSTQYLVGL
eukprot:scaffold310556_cov26-Tisochrysis_lutea.AAC.1